MQRLLLLLALVAALAATACSDDGEETAPTPSPIATRVPTATPTPTPTATPAVPVVRWVPAELPSIFTGTEYERPFADILDDRDQWGVYLVEGDGEPRLLRQTRRYIGTEWSNDSVTLFLPFRSTGEVPGETLAIGGLMAIDVANGSLSTELVVDNPGRIYSSPDGSLLAINEGSGHPHGIYLSDRSGRTWRLEGLGQEVRIIDWAPDGSGLLVHAPGYGWVIVPTAGGPATVVGTVHTFSYQALWSPDGNRLTYLVDGDAYVFDRSTGQRRQITSGGRYPHGPDPRWSADGREIIVGADLIELATGNVVASVMPGGGFVWSALSRDGRYFVVLGSPSYGYGGEGPCEGANYPGRNRGYLWDRRTGETRFLFDCQGLYLLITWVSDQWSDQWLSDGRHLLLWTPECSNCDSLHRSITLVDVETGETKPLTDGLEPDTTAYPSPDGRRFLVTGNRLRLYTAEGQLLREFTVPEGFAVTSAAWAPDGSSFAYVVGPAGFSTL